MYAAVLLIGVRVVHKEIKQNIITVHKATNPTTLTTVPSTTRAKCHVSNGMDLSSLVSSVI